MLRALQIAGPLVSYFWLVCSGAEARVFVWLHHAANGTCRGITAEPMSTYPAYILHHLPVGKTQYHVAALRHAVKRPRLTRIVTMSNKLHAVVSARVTACIYPVDGCSVNHQPEAHASEAPSFL
jgi:hypothetical protein